MNAITKRTRRALVAAAVSAPVLLASLAAAAPASAHRPQPRPQSGPPVVRVDLPWRFQIGAQVDQTAATEQPPGQDMSVFHVRIPVELTWSARAQGHSRIAGYDFSMYNPQSGLLNPMLTDTLKTSYQTRHVDLSYPVPGPSGILINWKYRLVATDTAGRSTVVDPIPLGPQFSEQENGVTYQDGRTVFPSAPQAGRGWQQRSGDDYDAGSVLASRQRGATVRIPVKANARGQWFALEMTTGPRLGAVEVRVDGRRVGTVDTYSATTRPRVLVAQYRLSGGDHTITLVNLGTHNRPTVELDGIFASD